MLNSSWVLSACLLTGRARTSNWSCPLLWAASQWSEVVFRVGTGWASVHSHGNTVSTGWQNGCRGKVEASHSRCGLSFPLRWQINLCPWSVNYWPSHSQPSTASLLLFVSFSVTLSPLRLSLCSFSLFFFLINLLLSDFFFSLPFYEAPLLFSFITIFLPFTLMSLMFSIFSIPILFPWQFDTLLSVRPFSSSDQINNIDKIKQRSLEKSNLLTLTLEWLHQNYKRR